MVERRAGRGTFVADRLPDSGDAAKNWLLHREFELKDLLEARRAIEPVCAQLAASKATPQDVTYLMGLLYRFEIGVQQEDAREMASADGELHARIAALSQNRVLITIAEMLNRQLMEYRLNLFSVKGNGVHAIQPHREIVARIAEGRGEEASLEMLAHVNDIFKNLHDITHS